MNTERTSLSAAASPGPARDDVTGIPSGASSVGERLRGGPDASAGVARPRAGTGPSSATSAKRAPASAASSRLSSGPAVFTSAYTASARSAGSALAALPRPPPADVNESTTSRSYTASSASATPFATARVVAAHVGAGRLEVGRDPPARLTEPEHGERRQ